MSSPTFASLVAPLRGAAVRAAWTQWGAISSAATGPAGHAVVDPEALVLASLALAPHEPRLDRVMRLWISQGARVLSAGRLSNLRRDYPDTLAPAVAEFAALVLGVGDARWRKLAGSPAAPADHPRGPGRPLPDQRRPTALMLRLRLGLGVGIKADALSFLIGLAGSAHSVREIAKATGYGERAVRRGLEDLAAARLLDGRPTSPATYLARKEQWYGVLGIEEAVAPLWRYWHELFVIAHALDDWARRADAAGWARYVAGSRLRDVFERLAPFLLRAGVGDLPDWSSPPEDWPLAVEPWVAGMAKRLTAVA